MKLQSSDRAAGGTSKYDTANTDIIESQHFEIKQLKDALEAAKRERQNLEKDRERERQMFLDSDAKVGFAFQLF